jgi:hypothetical protein
LNAASQPVTMIESKCPEWHGHELIMFRWR